MTSAFDLFEEGHLDQALRSAIEQVRQAPSDSPSRTLLFTLLGFAGDLDRAEKHLNALAHQDHRTDLAAQVYRNLLHAERLRRRLFANGLAPEFLMDPPAWMRHVLDAVLCLVEQRHDDARRSVQIASAEQPPLCGHWGDVRFECFRDADDLLAPILELFVLRNYVWLPFAQIRELEVLPPENPRDLLWAPLHVTLSNGVPHRGYAPVMYPASHESPDDRVKLGHVTEWIEGANGFATGRGQHTIVIGDEDRGLLELRRIVFDH